MEPRDSVLALNRNRPKPLDFIDLVAEWCNGESFSSHEAKRLISLLAARCRQWEEWAAKLQRAEGKDQDHAPEQDTGESEFNEAMLLSWIEGRVAWMEDIEKDPHTPFQLSEGFRNGYRAALRELIAEGVAQKFHHKKKRSPGDNLNENHN